MGGSKLGWLIAATVCRFRPRSHTTFFFSLDPLTNDRVPGAFPGFQDPPPPPVWGPTVRTQPFSGHYEVAEKSQILGDLQQPLGTLGPLLGDRLVTI